jgi:hypothetical protein
MLWRQSCGLSQKMLRLPFSLRPIAPDPCSDLIFGESVIFPGDPSCHLAGTFALAHLSRLAICERYTSEQFAPLHLAVDANCPTGSIATHAIDEFPDGMAEPSRDGVDYVRGLKNPGLQKPIVPIFCLAIIDRLRDTGEAKCDCPYVAVILWMIIGGSVERCGVEIQHPFDECRLVFFFAQVGPQKNIRAA